MKDTTWNDLLDGTRGDRTHLTCLCDYKPPQAHAMKTNLVWFYHWTTMQRCYRSPLSTAVFFVQLGAAL